MFYAIVLDWDYLGTSSTLDLIDSGASVAWLQTVTQYDPGKDVSSVVRAKFAVAQLQPHSIVNQYTGNANPAHICSFAALGGH